MNENKNIPLFILIGLLAVLIVGTISYSIGNDGRSIMLGELATQDEAIRDINNEISLLEIQITELIDAAQESTRAEIEKQIANEQARIAQLGAELVAESTKRKALETQFTESLSDAGELVDVITEWRPRTANVRCQFTFGTSGGSGVLIHFVENGKSIYGVLTNRHVLVDSLGRSAQSCTISFPDSNEQITVMSNKDEIEISTNGFDFGRLIINSPSVKIIQTAATEINFCKDTPSLGSGLTILGYPAIGSGNDITATEGIISGFEDDFYITSAKVEQGNSGGTAVLIRDNCLLGIPTFVQFGSLESLARILQIRTIYK